MFLHLSVIMSTGGGAVWQTPHPGRHPLCRHQPPGQTPLSRYPPETATAADGMHPTGMHSCYRQNMQVDTVFGHVCLFVCLYVQAITFEPLDIEISFLVCRYILTISRSSLSIKVIGSRSKSYEKK